MTTDRGYAHGLVLGKFMPAHLGHAHLIRFACAMCERVTIVVDRVAGEWPSAGERAAALREDCSGLPVNIVALPEPTPQQPEDHPAFWTFWRDALVGACGGVPDALVCAVEYGVPLAEAVGCTLLPLDIAREAIPLCATAIRADPWAMWDRMMPHARVPYLARIAIEGPESTGKSTIARAVASSLGFTYAPEWAKCFIEQSVRQGRGFAELDLLTIARGHSAAERSLEVVAHRALVADTLAADHAGLGPLSLWTQRCADRGPVRRGGIARAPASLVLHAGHALDRGHASRRGAGCRRPPDAAALLGFAGGGGGAPRPDVRDRSRRVRRQAAACPGIGAGAASPRARYGIGCV